MTAICVDACVLIGLVSPNDQHHEQSKELFEGYFEDEPQNAMLIPWPVTYETVATATVGRPSSLAALERALRSLEVRGRLQFLNDEPYREQALKDCFGELTQPLPRQRKLSLADRVIRAMIRDNAVRMDALVTFNSRDFADVCQSRRIELLPTVVK